MIPTRIPLKAMSRPMSNSRMTTMSWPCGDKDTAANLARTIETLMMGALVWCDELPLWQSHYHVAAKSNSDGTAYVRLYLWPQPEADAE